MSFFIPANKKRGPKKCGCGGNGNNIVLKWHYEEDDDDMHEVGQEMSRISKLPFEYVEIKLK